VNVAECLEFVSNNVGWRMGNQNHKQWRIA